MRQAFSTFVISLDFELNWGVWPGEDSWASYKKAILGARSAIPSILDLFDKYEIHSTWATVGLLCFKNRNELLKSLPSKRPNYSNSKLGAYKHLSEIGEKRSWGLNQKDQEKKGFFQ